MRADIEKYELIEKYLGGQLTKKEKIDFEHQLKTDPELADELNKHKDISRLIHEGTLLKIRETVKEIHDAKYSLNFFKSSSGKILIITLAGILILTMVFFIKKYRIDNENQQPIENTIPAADTITLHESIEDTGEIVNHNEKTRHIPKPYKSSAKRVDHPIVSGSEFSESGKIHVKEEIKTDVVAKIPQEEIQKSEPDNDDVEKNSVTIIDTEIIHDSDSIDCSNVLISADVETKESCEQKPTGTIQIIESSIQGGTPPYSVSIDDGENFYSSFVFNELPQGSYILWLKDSYNCLSNSGNYWISSHDCSYKYIFAPEKGERWEAPNNGITGHLKIYSRQGKLVFSDRIDVTENYFWDGNSSAMDPLPMGVYQFLLELDNSERIFGNITIVR